MKGSTLATPSGQERTVFPATEVTDARAVFENPEHDFPQRITYTGAGETWVWEAAEGGRCPIRHDLIEGHRWRQGWVHHIDETRRPKATEALMETYNGRLVETGALREKAGR